VPDAAHNAPADDQAQVSKEFSASAQASWFASLPTMYGTAGSVFVNAAGHVLLVKPNYRDHWQLPGGIIEDGEAPHDGCRREVAEELGLDLEPGPLLAVGWAAPDGPRPKPIVVFVFDGGVLAEEAPIRLQESELDEYRFVAAADLDSYMPPAMRDRVSAALGNRGTGAVAYLPS
jgi:8-oxo-dGTP pyrophosphatase MutT (NUDIX family)